MAAFVVTHQPLITAGAFQHRTLKIGFCASIGAFGRRMYHYVTEVESIGCEVLWGAGSCSTLSYASWGPHSMPLPPVCLTL